MDPRTHPIPFPDILLQRASKTTGEDTAWKARFQAGKKQFLLPHEWRLLMYALGRRLLVGDEAFTKELETKPHCVLTTSAWRILRTFRDSQAAFIRSCAHRVPYLASIEAWSCFCTALRALKVESLSMTPAWSSAGEAVCIFSGSTLQTNLQILVFSYTTRDAVSGVESLVLSPGYVCSVDFLPLVHSWMAIGHAETFLNEFLYDLIKTPQENKDENTAMQLLDSAFQNSRELRDAVRMINCATFYLFHANTRFRSQQPQVLRSEASTRAQAVSVKREASDA